MVSGYTTLNLFNDCFPHSNAAEDAPYLREDIFLDYSYMVKAEIEMTQCCPLTLNFGCIYY